MQKLQLATFLSLALLSVSSYSEQLNIGVTDHCPIVCLEPNKAPHGLAISVLRKAFSAPQYQLSFTSFPVLRSLSELKAGKLTAIASKHVIQNDNILWPSNYRILTNACAYSSMDSNWRYDPADISNLNDIKYGLIKSYDNRQVDQQSPKNIVYLHPGENTVENRMLKMIASRRLDAGFISQITTDYLIQKHGFSNSVQSAGCGVKVYQASIAIYAKTPNAALYQQKIDTAYRDMRISGAFSELMKSYHLAQKVIDLNINHPIHQPTAVEAL